jgi:hypothetical protein
MDSANTGDPKTRKDQNLTKTIIGVAASVFAAPD